MGGARFGIADGLLLLALQAAACWLALRASGHAVSWRSWGLLTLLSFLAAFVLHIAAFALLGAALPGESLRWLRRGLVALVWGWTSAATGWLVLRSAPAPQRRTLALWFGLATLAGYAVFMLVNAARR